MKTIRVCFASCLLISNLCLWTAAAQSSAAKAKQSPAVAAPKHLAVDDIIAMVGAGISDDVIIARLQKENQPFDLSTDEILRLKKAKVSDSVLKVMMDPKAAPAAPSQSYQPIVIQPPAIPGLPTVHQSGATPSSGASATVDSNDPLAPHDSGVYFYTKDRDGNPKMIPLERAAYQGAKTGGMFSYAMTYGLAKMKTKAVIPGTRAGIRVSDSSPVFYFYFEDKQAGLGKTYFGVADLSNPNQFALLKLEVNKSNRETIVGQFGSLGSSSGSDEKAMIQFKSERIRDGLYKVTIDNIKSGEYAFMASGHPMMAAGPMGAAYGAGAAGAADIFDFGVNID